MKVTAEKILDFYKDKPAEVKCVKKYMENHDPNGDYAKVIETFLRLQGLKSGRKPYGENAKFYNWLKPKLEKGGLESFQTLHFLSSSSGIDESKCDILLQNGGESATQKRHLYVSWTALKEYWAEENVPNRSGYNPNANVAFYCPELLLWMCEAAADKADEEQLGSFYERLISIKERERKLDADMKLWISGISKVIEEKIQKSEPAKEEKSI